MNIDKKSFMVGSILGTIVGILLFAVMFWNLAVWMSEHPATDCDTCIEGTTP